MPLQDKMNKNPFIISEFKPPQQKIQVPRSIKSDKKINLIAYIK